MLADATPPGPDCGAAARSRHRAAAPAPAPVAAAPVTEASIIAALTARPAPVAAKSPAPAPVAAPGAYAGHGCACCDDRDRRCGTCSCPGVATRSGHSGCGCACSDDRHRHRAPLRTRGHSDHCCAGHDDRHRRGDAAPSARRADVEAKPGVVASMTQTLPAETAGCGARRRRSRWRDGTVVPGRSGLQARAEAEGSPRPAPAVEASAPEAKSARVARAGWVIQVGAFDAEHDAQQRLIQGPRQDRPRARSRRSLHRDGPQGREDALPRAFCRLPAERRGRSGLQATKT